MENVAVARPKHISLLDIRMRTGIHAKCMRTEKLNQKQQNASIERASRLSHSTVQAGVRYLRTSLFDPYASHDPALIDGKHTAHFCFKLLALFPSDLSECQHSSDPGVTDGIAW